MLNIRVRLTNKSDKDTTTTVISSRNYEKFYATAGSKKYFILMDSEKVALASPHDVHGNINVKLAKGESWLWWAKYPAPPADVKKITYFMSFSVPFEDVPITE